MSVFVPFRILWEDESKQWGLLSTRLSRPSFVGLNAPDFRLPSNIHSCFAKSNFFEKKNKYLFPLTPLDSSE
jgi:hypothetical protein